MMQQDANKASKMAADSRRHGNNTPPPALTRPKAPGITQLNPPVGQVGLAGEQQNNDGYEVQKNKKTTRAEKQAVKQQQLEQQAQQIQHLQQQLRATEQQAPQAQQQQQQQPQQQQQHQSQQKTKSILVR